MFFVWVFSILILVNILIVLLIVILSSFFHLKLEKFKCFCYVFI